MKGSKAPGQISNKISNMYLIFLPSTKGFTWNILLYSYGNFMGVGSIIMPSLQMRITSLYGFRVIGHAQVIHFVSDWVGI